MWYHVILWPKKSQYFLPYAFCMTHCEASAGGGRAVAVGAVSGGGSGGVVRSSSGPDPSRKTSDPKPSVPKESIKSTMNPTSDGLPEYWHLDLHFCILLHIAAYSYYIFLCVAACVCASLDRNGQNAPTSFKCRNGVAPFSPGLASSWHAQVPQQDAFERELWWNAPEQSAMVQGGPSPLQLMMLNFTRLRFSYWLIIWHIRTLPSDNRCNYGSLWKGLWATSMES